MRRRMTCLVLGWLAFCVLWGLYSEDSRRRPVADEAAFVLMSESLWLDGDLVFDRGDAERALKRWPRGPGLIPLRSADGWRTAFFDRPVIYPLIGLPFFVLWGAGGLVVLNALSFAAMVALAYRQLADQGGWPGLYVGGFFGASAAAAYVFIPQHQVVLMAALFSAALAWLRWRHNEHRPGPWIGVGLLLAVSASAHTALGAVAVTVAVDLALERRWRPLAAVVLSFLLTWISLLSAVAPPPAVAEGSPALDSRLLSAEAVLRNLDAESAEKLAGLGQSTAPRQVELRAFLLEAWYFLAGRFEGLVAYYPFALFAWVLFGLSPGDRPRLLLAATVFGLSIWAVWARTVAVHAGVIGHRELACFYPLLLLLPGRFTARRSLLVPYALAGVWTVHAVTGVLAAGSPHDLLLHTRLPSFRVLPVELTRLGEAGRFGFSVHDRGRAVWIVPRDDVAAADRKTASFNVRGGSTVEIWLIAPKRLQRLELEARTQVPDNVLVLTSAAASVTVRFDSEAKRQATPIELAVEPEAVGLGLFYPYERFYRLRVRTSGFELSPDTAGPRLLGVRLDFGLI